MLVKKEGPYKSTNQIETYAPDVNLFVQMSQEKQDTKQRKAQEKKITPVPRLPVHDPQIIKGDFIPKRPIVIKKFPYYNQQTKLEEEKVYTAKELPNTEITNRTHLRKAYMYLKPQEKGKRARKVQQVRSPRGYHNTVSQQQGSEYRKCPLHLVRQKNKQRKQFQNVVRKEKVRFQQTRHQIINLEDRLLQSEQRISRRNRIKKTYKQKKNRTETERQQRSTCLNKRCKRKVERYFQKEEFDSRILEKLPKSEETFLKRNTLRDFFTKMYEEEKKEKEKEEFQSQVVVENTEGDTKRIASSYVEYEENYKYVGFGSRQKQRRFRYQRQQGRLGKKTTRNQKLNISEFRTKYIKKKVYGEVHSGGGLGQELDMLHKKVKPFVIPKPAFKAEYVIRPRGKRVERIQKEVIQRLKFQNEGTAAKRKQLAERAKKDRLEKQRIEKDMIRREVQIEREWKSKRQYLRKEVMQRARLHK